MIFTSPADVYAYLDGFLNFERKLEPTEYRLDRMRTLRELYGRPDEAYRTIHVAGSKGKGSTATMIASILGTGGDTIGLYTSPHLLSFTERIAIDMKPVGNELLIDAAGRLADRMAGKTADEFPGGEAPTFFELLTMLGFLCFKNAGCSSAVIEVGLGGRLDSTNVILPVASVITSIELEHTEILGDTIAKIAYEKAGIIKEGVPSFTSATRPEALAVIKARAAELGSPLVSLDEVADIRDLSIGRDGTRATVVFKDAAAFGRPLAIHSPQIGAVQARNAAMAAIVCRSLGSSDEAIRSGIAGARLRARFEIVIGSPIVVLDGAHTADSMQACADDFKRIFPEGGCLLFGCAKGKPPKPMAEALRSSFSEAIITKPGTFKESDPAEIEAAFKDSGYAVDRVDDTEAAIHLALERAASRGAPLLIAGSFYLCAAAAAILDARA